MSTYLNKGRTLALSITGIALVATLAACSSGTTPTAATTANSTKRVHLSLALVSASLAFSEETRAGAEAAAKKYNAQLDVTGPALEDPPTAISQVENSLRAGVDGIAIAGEPAALWTRTFKDAMTQTKGNVIAFTSVPTSGSGVGTYIGIQASDYGTQLATETVKASGLGKKTTGDVIVGECSNESDPLTATSNAAAARLKQLLPKTTVLPVFNSQLSPADNFSAWNQEIAAHPDTALAIGTCDQDGASMLKAKLAHKAHFAIGSVQTSPQVLAGLKDGTVSVVVPQNYFVTGYLLVKLLAEAARSGKKPTAGWINTGITVVTKANVAALTKRDSGAAGQRAFYAPLITKTLDDLPAITKPMSALG